MKTLLLALLVVLFFGCDPTNKFPPKTKYVVTMIHVHALPNCAVYVLECCTSEGYNLNQEPRIVIADSLKAFQIGDTVEVKLVNK